MRLTDDRYAGERSQFELALRMIRHEARTRTIRDCTGLSDDRIRKLYSTYFRDPSPSVSISQARPSLRSAGKARGPSTTARTSSRSPVRTSSQA